MPRTTVTLPAVVAARLRREAERRGVTVSKITREAIEAFLDAPNGKRRFYAAAAGVSGRSDISDRIEEILTTEIRPSH